MRFAVSGVFGHTFVSSTTTNAVVSTIDKTESRYLSVTKTGSLIVKPPLFRFAKFLMFLSVLAGGTQLGWCAVLL